MGTGEPFAAVTADVAETEALGEKLAAHLHGGEVVSLTGEMGAGKTAFCRGLARGLGCVDEVSSPTYALVNYYRGPLPLAHMDAWRMEGEDDLEASGFYEFLACGAVVAMEWGARVKAFLPPGGVAVSMEILAENKRRIEIAGVRDF